MKKEEESNPISGRKLMERECSPCLNLIYLTMREPKKNNSRYSKQTQWQANEGQEVEQAATLQTQADNWALIKRVQ